MPALNRAVALEEVDDLAAPVAEDLELDVAGLFDVALEQQSIVAERFLRFAPGRLDRGRELARAAHDPHPLPPPPALAFTSSGNPMRFASAASVSGDCASPS